MDSGVSYQPRGLGLYIGDHDYGVIAKCPHCDATNIKRSVKFQKICGREACQKAQRKSTQAKLALKRARAGK